MKLSDIKGERAITVIGEILDPVTDILGDEEVSKAFREKNKANAISLVLKKYPNEIIKILAILNEKSPDEYKKELNILTLPKILIEVLNDEELLKLFTFAE